MSEERLLNYGCLGLFLWQDNVEIPDVDKELPAFESISLSPVLQTVSAGKVKGKIEAKLKFCSQSHRSNTSDVALKKLDKDFFDDGFSDYDEFADEDIIIKPSDQGNLFASDTCEGTYSFTATKIIDEQIISLTDIDTKSEKLWLEVLDVNKEFNSENEIRVSALIGIFPLQIAREGFFEAKLDFMESLPCFEEIDNDEILANISGLIEPYMIIRDGEILVKGELQAKIALKTATNEYKIIDTKKPVDWSIRLPEGKVTDILDIHLRVNQVNFREEGWFRFDGEALLPVLMEGNQDLVAETIVNIRGDAEEQSPEPEQDVMKDEFKVDWLKDWVDGKDIDESEPKVSKEDEVAPVVSMTADVAEENKAENLLEEIFDGDSNRHEPVEEESSEVDDLVNQIDEEIEKSRDITVEAETEVETEERSVEESEVDTISLVDDYTLPQVISDEDEVQSEEVTEEIECEQGTEASEDEYNEQENEQEVIIMNDNVPQKIAYTSDKPAKIRSEHATWKFYFLKQGDSIESISEKVGAKPEDILARNKLSRVNLEQSKVILIPISS